MLKRPGRSLLKALRQARKEERRHHQTSKQGAGVHCMAQDEVDLIESVILTVRGRRVILSGDLARIYGVEARALNQAVKRNVRKFPEDFMFRLTSEEAAAIHSKSQSVILKRGQNIKYLPYAFTEHGAIMAANVLNSSRAVEMSVFVVRAFVKMRAALAGSRELAVKLAALEKELKERLDVHEVAIVTVLQRVMEIIDPPLQPDPPRKRIGFGVKEGRARYQIKGRNKPL